MLSDIKINKVIFFPPNILIMNSIISIINYLKQLKDNNNREWFNEHKDEYLVIRDAFEALTQQFIDLLQLEDNLIVGLKAKDCIFRIYRDVRFSKDKSPYKTYLGAYISQGGRKSKFCGYYLHLEPDTSLLAGGLHCPDANVLYEVRDAIYAETADFKNIINAPDFLNTFKTISGDQLKRGPKDFPKDFEDIDLLKYKSYDLISYINEADLGKDDFIVNGMKTFRAAKPFNDFFNKAILAMES